MTNKNNSHSQFDSSPQQTEMSRLVAKHSWKFKIQKGRNGLLFLRTIYDSKNIFIESYKFDSDGIVPKGISWDQADGIYQESIYSFQTNHVYFIDIVARDHTTRKALDDTKSYFFYNTDIIITQICNNDESPDIRSRMDLVLSCKGIWYNDTKVLIKNVATAALFSSETNTLLISMWQPILEKTICKFDMAEIEKEFQKARNFCQNSTTKHFNDCNNEELVNSCNNSIISSLSLPKSPQTSQYENMVIYGRIVYSSSDFDEITAIFPSNENSDEIYELRKNGKLIKIPFSASHLFDTVLDFNTNILNQRYITQWKEKAGFIFIDPSTKKSVYFKNATCNNKGKCHGIFSSDSITCHKCHVVSHSNVSCNLEMQTICPPMWYNKKSDFNHRWSEFDEKTGIKKAECFKPSLSEADNCSWELKDYLKPIFQLPYTFVDHELYENKFWNFQTFATILCLIFGAATCSIALYFYYKNKKLSERKAHSSKTKLEEFNKRYLISGKNVALLELLGSGFTSDVYSANFTDNSSPIKVAVKTLKINAKKEDILKEIQLLSVCKHSNIVTFIGWIEQEPHTCIVTEFMGGGDLHAYLKTPTNLLLLSTVFSYIFQILDAMIYLSHQKILHRDLAARNCLLDENFELLKLNDFGLSRKMNLDYQYISEADPHLPFKWLPLEAFEPSTMQHKIFTLKGDIWSLGILIWEMFERGNEPYDGMNYSATLKFLKTGNRLPQSKKCPLELYKIICRCWEKDPENRPKFDAIQNDVKDVFSQIKTNTPNLLNTPIEINITLEIINENYVYQRS